MASVDAQYLPADYFPIIIQFFFALGFVALTMLVTHLIGPSRKSKVKDESFECGLEPVGNARNPFSVKYFLTAILFVLFDVEVIFMYPWALNFREIGWPAFIEMLIFIGILLAGFIYVIKKGTLNWE